MTRFSTVDYQIDSFAFASWEGCTDCSGGPTPGARALLAYWLEQAPPVAAEIGLGSKGEQLGLQIRSMGIYNCRTVRGGTARSIHACGRAVDCGIAVSVNGHRTMVEFLRRLAPHAKGLGVQLAIFSRLSGSARHPWPNDYRGTHPHHDHLHIELNGAAAQTLTLATLRSRVGDWRPDPGTPPSPTPPDAADDDSQPPAPWEQTVVDRLEVVRFDRGNIVGDEVKVVQGLLAARGVPPTSSFRTRTAGNLRYVTPDGFGRARTRAALSTFQARTNTGGRAGPDLIVGDRTWAALIGTVRQIRFDRGLVRGGVVAAVQALLAAQGHPPANSLGRDGRPDRIGGRHTRDALAAFQREHTAGGSSGADLIVGPKTWDALLDS